MEKTHLHYHLDYFTTKTVLVISLNDLLHNYSVYDYTVQLSINIEKLLTTLSQEKCDIVIFDNCTPYIRGIDDAALCSQLERYSLPVKWVIVTSDYAYANSTDRIIYYPIYLIDGVDKGGWSTVDIVRSRSSAVGFLSYHLHAHRLMTMLALFKQPWFHACRINLPTVEQMTSSQLTAYETGITFLDTRERKELEHLFKFAPIKADSTDNQQEIVNIENLAFTDSYVNVFTESDFPRRFVTEKSVKPFLSGQFTAVIANASAYSHLEDLGFDLMQNYINLRIDSEDIRKNISHVINEISNLLPNINDAWEQSYESRLHNYNLARSSKFRDKLCANLRNWING